MNILLITIIICLTILIFTAIIAVVLCITSKMHYTTKIAARGSLDYLISSISDIEKNKYATKEFEAKDKDYQYIANEYYKRGWKDGYIDCKNDIINRLKNSLNEI